MEIFLAGAWTVFEQGGGRAEGEKRKGEEGNGWGGVGGGGGGMDPV